MLSGDLDKDSAKDAVQRIMEKAKVAASTSTDTKNSAAYGDCITDFSLFYFTTRNVNISCC